MVRETALSPDDLIYPLFVVHGQDVRRPIASMPGVRQLSVDQAVAEAGAGGRAGDPGRPSVRRARRKDALGSENYADDGIVQQAVRASRPRYPELIVIADLCMCEYTDHGHCGVIRGRGQH